MSTPNEPRSPFRALPNPKRIWLGAPGSREESLGSLARLTPSIVAAAARSEIKDGGKRVGLKWDVMKLEHSQFGRQSCRHEILSLRGAGRERVGGLF